MGDFVMEVMDLVILFAFVCMQLMVIFFFVFLLRKRQLWPLIMLGLTGHGSLAQKFLPDNGVEFVFNKKPINRILWNYKDRNGKPVKNPQKITDVKHRLAGTSIPIHLCPYDKPTNVSILETKGKDATSEEMNELLTYSYMQGVIDTRKMIAKPVGLGIDLKMIAVIGMIALIVLMAYPQVASLMKGG